jgi:micrococcal nuclease
MQTIQNFSTWFSKQKISGKVAIGCSGLFALCCLCSIPVAVFSPSAPTLVPTSSSTPTHTPTITFTPTLTNTPTLVFTLTITSTPTITPTPTVTFTPLPTLPTNINSCIPTTTKREIGSVVGIVDGDTIDVKINNQVYRVRYIGIDTPERNEIFYSQATQFNQILVFNKTVTLVKDVSETDQFNRLLRYVIVGDIFVNYELANEGYAVSSTYPPDIACSTEFSSAERKAQIAEVGFWKPTATPASVSSGGGSGSGNCDSSYPGICIPPPPPDLDCKDIPYKRFQVLSPDPHGFDGDHDGIGCES